MSEFVVYYNEIPRIYDNFNVTKSDDNSSENQGVTYRALQPDELTIYAAMDIDKSILFLLHQQLLKGLTNVEHPYIQIKLTL